RFPLIADTTGGFQDQRELVGELMVYVQGLMAYEDNKKRSQRTKDNIAQSRLKGRWFGGTPPYALTWSESAGWAIIEDQAEIIREGYRRVIAGESCVSVGKDFDQRGIPAPGAKMKRKEGARAGKTVGKGLWAWALYWCLTKPTYRGEWASRKGAPSIAVPAIVSAEVWARAQEAISKGRQRGL